MKTLKIHDEVRYNELCEDIRGLLEAGRLAAAEALSEIRNRTYWKIGERLSRVPEIGRYGSASTFSKRLAADIGIAPSVLYRALQFFELYPDGLPAHRPEIKLLPWAAHVELFPVKDERRRDWYMSQALQRRWSARKLRRAIRSNLFENRGLERKKTRAQLDRPGSGLHIYAAELERVVDGDTLEVRIDLGFWVWKSEKIRLRGVDSPELGTREGHAAKKFVEGMLEGIEMVVVKTYRTDKYARFVGDVFFDPSLDKKEIIFEKGRFLNQELITAGHANLMLY